MASTNTVTQTSKTVERVSEIFVNKVIDNRLFELPNIQLLRATRDVFSMATFSQSGMVQAYATKPTPTGTTSLTDQEFTIVKKSIFHDIPYDIFKDTKWKSAIENINEEGLPAEFVDVLSENLGESVAADVCNELINGNGGLAGDPTGGSTINGFAQLIKARLTAASLTSRIITLTNAADDPADPAKIQGILSQGLAVLPKSLRSRRQDVKIMVDPVVEAALYQSYSQTAMTNIPQNNSLVFQRFDVEVLPNLNTNRIIIGIPGNMGIGMPTEAGVNLQLNIKDKYTEGEGNFARAFGNFGYGAGIATTDWVVIEYDPTI